MKSTREFVNAQKVIRKGGYEISKFPKCVTGITCLYCGENVRPVAWRRHPCKKMKIKVFECLGKSSLEKETLRKIVDEWFMCHE
jgi:hypothetical protein